MAIDFPNNPAVGELYSTGLRTWKWNGTSWESYLSVTTPTNSLLVDGNAKITGITTIGSSVGVGTTALLVEGNARVTGILSVGQGTITLNGNTDSVGIGTTNITEALHVVGNIYSSGTVTGSGNVIQVGFSTDPGSNTTSTTLTNANASLFTFTPKRSDSRIYQIWSWGTITSTVAATNTSITFAIAEGNTNTRLVSPVYQAYSVEASDGDGMASTASVQVSVASTGTSTRSFSVFHRSNTATNTVYSYDIRCTFIEVAP